MPCLQKDGELRNENCGGYLNMDKFKRFGNSIDRLITGKDLSRKEAMDLFIVILNGEQTEIHQGALLEKL